MDGAIRGSCCRVGALQRRPETDVESAGGGIKSELPERSRGPTRLVRCYENAVRSSCFAVSSFAKGSRNHRTQRARQNETPAGVADGRIRRGQRLLLMGTGAGLSFGGVVITY